jgi:hypothetical protein
MILTEPKGLSQADIKSLLAELQASAVNSVGAEMIYELVEVAAGFITDRHSNIERGKQTSLEEVRKQRAAEEEKVRAPSNGFRIRVRERSVADGGGVALARAG